MAKQLTLYVSSWCGQCLSTRRALDEWRVPYSVFDINRYRAAAERVRRWVGFESVPTLVMSEGEGLDPFEPPAPLGGSTRGVDRGSVITEASLDQTRTWLIKHGLLPR